MALIGKIRGMRMRDGKSISEISRLTSLSRNTIKKWLSTPQSAAPKYRRRDVSTKLAAFVATLTQALEVDARRAKHERRTARTALSPPRKFPCTTPSTCSGLLVGHGAERRGGVCALSAHGRAPESLDPPA